MPKIATTTATGAIIALDPSDDDFTSRS
jgi:hypothetical protein